MRRPHIDASFFLLLGIIGIVVGGALFVYYSTRVDPVDTALSGDQIVNTLIVFEKDGKPLSTHVLMYYPETKRAALIDVPGECGLIIKSLGRVDRIDALYKHRKPQPYIDQIADLLDVDIPFFLEMDMDEASKLVDLMSGVEIFISDPVREYDESPKILLPSGANSLDGTKASLYATYSLADEDAGNPISRRQRFTLSVFKRMGEMYQFLSDGKVRSYFGSLIHTNLNDRSLDRLLGELRGVDIDRVTVQRVQGIYKEVSGQKLLFPSWDGSLIKDIVKQSLASLARDADGWTSDRVYTVEVLNGTPGQGLARRASDLLDGFGYDILKVSNADRTDYAATVIVNRMGDPKAGRLLADVIHCASIRNEPRAAGEGAADGGADFTLIIGKDFNGRFVTQ